MKTKVYDLQAALDCCEDSEIEILISTVDDEGNEEILRIHQLTYDEKEQVYKIIAR
jgi:hypothetical protein